MKILFLKLFVFTCFFPALSQTRVSLFRDSALDCHWNPADRNLVAYSFKGKDKYYDIYIASPDRKFEKCITENHPLLPNRHICLPSWHPSGKWIIFLAEKKEHPRGSVNALPGFGAYCDIYVMSVDGKKVFKVLELPNDFDHGVIAPRFSPDGSKIVWTDRIMRPSLGNPQRHFGFWTVKTADFTWAKDSVPAVSNVKDLLPGKNCFNESYGYSPDGEKIIFCSSMNTGSAWLSQLFTMNADGSEIKQLTEGDYNEHGCFTPDGKRIVWMTNKGNKNKGTDWWIMDVNGKNKKRLSFFNDPGNPQYKGRAVWTGLGSFSPEGNRFIGGIQKSLITQEGYVVIVELGSE
ncbi:MAG: TolB family protein [Bacteroidia bacterium]